jgi:hypothetical protein
VNPYLIIAAMIAVGGAYAYGHHAGYADRDAEMQAHIAKLNEESRAKEQELAASLNNQTETLRKAKNEINKKQSDINALVDAGRLRLPVPAAPSCVQTAPDASPPIRDRGEERPDPYREAIKAVVAIAIEGDRNTVQLNACIDTYNKVREQINGQR